MRFLKAYHYCIFLVMLLFVFLGIFYMYSTNVNKRFNSREIIKSIINSHEYIKKDDVNFKIPKVVKKPQPKIDDNSKLEENSKNIPSRAPVKKTSNEIVSLNFGFTSASQAEEFYYNTITKNTFVCNKAIRIGRQDDGGWDVCFNDNFNLKKSDCLSYSFGVNNIWEFDDDVSQKYGCVVRTFDPSMTGSPEVMQRASKVWFYKIGLGKDDTKWSNGWNIKKMSSLLKQFNEEDKVIDILKIDIEFSEWDSFESMIKDGLLSKVKQLLFETHTEELQGRTTSMDSYVRFLRIWNSIYNAGFRQWKNHWNPYGQYTSKNTNKPRTCCFEHYLVNINYQ